MKKNVSGQVIGCQLVSKTDGSAVTAGTTTVYVTGDGGTQATGSVGSGACTHEGNGFWTYAPAQAETNYDHVAFTFVNTSACNVTAQVYTTFPQTGDSFARIGATGSGLTSLASQASVDTVDDFLDTEIAAIKAKTDNLPASPAATGAAMTLTSAYDFAKGTVAMTESYAVDGATATPAQMLYMLWSLMAEKSISSTTLTAKKLDGSTTAMQFTLNDASSPTSITRES